MPESLSTLHCKRNVDSRSVWYSANDTPPLAYKAFSDTKEKGSEMTRVFGIFSKHCPKINIYINNI